MTTPTLAILIPVYNVGRFLRATLESVRTQTSCADEVIILDNCSTDDTPAIAREFADLPGFRFERNTENIGAVPNWIAIETLARSDYAMVLPGDDLLLPDCVDRWRNAVAAHPHLGLYMAGHRIIDGDGRELPPSSPAAPLTDGVSTGGKLIDWMMLYGQLNIVAGTVVDRSAYHAVGGFDARLRGALDFDLYVRLAGRGDIYYERAPNAVVREHDGQWSKDVYRTDNFDADVLFDKVAEMPFLTPEQIRLYVEGLCNYARQFYSRPLRDAQRTVTDIAGERKRAYARLQKWRTSGKAYAKWVRLWPQRWSPWLAWLAGGSRLGIWAMHRVLAGTRR